MLRRLVLCLVFIGAAVVASAQPVYNPPGSGTGGIIVGTTTNNCATAGGVFFDLAGVVQCDADLTFATDTLTATKLSTGGAPTAANAISVQETAGCITYEGATSDTTQTRLCATDPTGSDKTLTIQSITGSVAVAGFANPLNLLVTAADFWFGAGIGQGNAFNTAYAGFSPNRTTLTPDSGFLATGTTGNSIHFGEVGDAAFDFQNPCNGVQGTAACTDPTFIVHSHNQDTLEWLTFSHDGNAGVIQAANSTRKSGEIKFGRTVALTEAGAAETVITITTATTQSFGLELSYQVRASDATPDYAVREGSLKLVCVNNATVVTCTKDATTQADDESVLINTNSKTLTYAIAVNVATANVAILTWDIDSDMTVTAAEITFTAVLNGSGVIS